MTHHIDDKLLQIYKDRETELFNEDKQVKDNQQLKYQIETYCYEMKNANKYRELFPEEEWN